MTHILDRPIWHALRTSQSCFAEGNERALRYHADVAPFAASGDDDDKSLAALAVLIHPGENSILLQAGDAVIPPQCVVDIVSPAVQMVAVDIDPPEEADRAVKLTEGDAVQMLALATLTKPGPFLPKTHLLGDFYGIKIENRLVAMAGERMRLDGYTELSGVCTHPDFRSRGYAGLLSRLVAARIFERGETPFLHAYASNVTAIGLYEQLGFAHRSDMSVAVVRGQ